MNEITVDIDLVKKYNIPGPRYTSYPPAVHFSNNIKWEDIKQEIERNNIEKGNLSLYFHIPFCYSLCWFCGCTSIITPNVKQSSTYINYLEKELDIIAPLLNPKRKVVQLHLGGGSPTFMPVGDIERLGELIHKRFTFSDDIEAGVEMDPRRMVREQVKAFRKVGFNRASLGIQDFNPKVQKAVHRIQPKEMTAEVIGWIREFGFHSLNIDLIYGLPFQTPESFEKTINDVLEFKPDRFAVFSYAHVPWIKPSQKIFEYKQNLPSPETKFQLLKLVTEKLTRSGYVYIGMDHFALETDELVKAQRTHTLQRNFQGYSTRAGADIYAFGMSSISQTDSAYWQNHKDLKTYYSMLNDGELPLVRGFILSDDDKIRRITIMRLMCDLGLNYNQMSEILGIDFQKYFEKEIDSLSDLEQDNLVKRTDEGIEITHLGRLFIRIVA
ncbi:MAG TPA: oxygen-independent coproporphyrinogen III oxidase, partial [Verrucomicrobiota bacterium]|nr:oxygen-independent coproporphyrinogen III oxidase [Verrucomicrobiota bacterium]